MADRTVRLCAQARINIVAVSFLTMVMTATAWPQAVQSPQPAAPEPALPQSETPPLSPEAPPRKENPGLINEIGKLFGSPSSMLPALKTPGETMDDLNARARDAGDALVRLTKFPGVTGREKCPVAANGAPDCKTAADKLCQGKGFKEGKSLETDSTRNCSPLALLSGRKPDENKCRTDNFVTRALCQ